MGISLQLKLADCVNGCPNCPPTGAAATNRTAYRFAFNPLCSKSFVPVHVAQPDRKLDDSQQCVKCALSLYAEEEKAVAKYQSLKMKVKNIERLIGTHLAEGKLTKADGLATTPNGEGHFSFFESSKADLPNAFSIKSAL